MTKTYGIPKVLSVSELIYFNNGRGSIRVNFEGGIPDDKNDIPATFVTDNEVIQQILEKSPKFGKVYFRYNSKGKIIKMEDLETETSATAKTTRTALTKKVASPADATVYEDVETLGQATEVLLELGCPAGELNGPDAILTAMKVYRAKFPNLKVK